MPFFKSDDLQIWTNGTWFNLKAKKTDIRGFSTDSRNMQKDFAFVAIKAERDGHDFAANAIENGATAIIAERELDVDIPVLVVKDSLKALQTIAKFHRLRFESPVVAISGSCGKTSTKEMLANLDIDDTISALEYEISNLAQNLSKLQNEKRRLANIKANE